MKTDLVSTGDLSSQLTIVLETADYQPKYDADLKKQQKSANLKGFRKGKVPMSAVRKMFGKAILNEVINSKLQTAIGDYITENKIDILGNPLPAEDQQMFDFDPKELSDYTFKFDLGLAPEVVVKGAKGEDSYDTYVVEFGEKEIDEEIENLLKRGGKQEEVEDSIEELDVVGCEITATQGEESWTGEITLMPDRLNDEYKDALIGKKAGHEMSVNIYEVEKDAKEDYVQKYFLKDAPEWVGRDFALVVKSVKRLIPATMDEEFLKQTFGAEDIKDEAGAREFLSKELSQYYEKQAGSITKRRSLEHLLDNNDYPLPEAFLKRWLVASNDDLTPEQVEEEFEGFTKNLKWTLIKSALAKDYDIQITPEQIKASMVSKFQAQFAQYGMGAMGGMDFNDIGDRMMQNQESVQKEYEELLAETVLDKTLENVTLVEQKIDVQAYKDIVAELQENNAQA